MTALLRRAGAETGLKGSHVLAMLLVFFAAVIAVNVVFISLALSSFPGEDAQHAYAQGLRYNETLATRRREAALGWRASLLRTDRIEGEAVIAVRFVTRNRVSLSTLRVRGVLRRPLQAADDAILSFVALGDGVYQARVASAPSGAWDLRVTAIGAAGQSLSFSERVLLP